MASSMAEAMAAPTPVMPLSPAPLMPSGLSGGGVILAQQHVRRRRFVHRREEIIGESDGKRIAALAVGELLQQRAAEPLRKAADDLAVAPAPD